MGSGTLYIYVSVKPFVYLCSCSRSERGIYLYSADALSSGAITNVHIDISPSTLIPFYDPDTSLVILTGKVGEKTKTV